MVRQNPRDSDGRFSAYLDDLASVIGPVSRVGPMRDYCTGLLLAGLAAVLMTHRPNAGVSDEITFKTKLQVALKLFQQLSYRGPARQRIASLVEHGLARVG